MNPQKVMKGKTMNIYPESDDALVRKVWQIMQQHKGHAHRIERDRLIVHVFGRVTKTYDRQLRDALSELPVVWDNGYFVPVDRDEAKGYIESMRSRIGAIAGKVRIIEDHLRHETEPVKVAQPKLLEVW